jgi:hypothetical protein
MMNFLTEASQVRLHMPLETAISRELKTYGGEIKLRNWWRGKQEIHKKSLHSQKDHNDDKRQPMPSGFETLRKGLTYWQSSAGNLY